MTFLALDIGNTRLKWAQYASPRPDAPLMAQGAEFLENIEKLAEGAWRGLLPPNQILGCAVAADAVKRRLQEQLDAWDVSPQWVVASEAEAGLRNGYDHPTRLGSDRWVAMIGAYHRMLSQGAPRPLVVVMVPVTVEALDASGSARADLTGPRHHAARWSRYAGYVPGEV
jgi:type III pantothenate kinase